MSEQSASWPSAATAAIPRAPAGTASLSVLFAVTSFLSSALIFIVEPMFAKMVLPLLGGTPAVWNTCLVFFQAVLLAGYGYAHITTTALTMRQQAVIHGALLMLAWVVLPVAVPAGWIPPVDSTPVLWLVIVLTVGLGAPFLMVSASAPLLQKWFAGTDHPAAQDPYFLYSASNVGSILALLAYPLLIEPALPLSQQSSMWTVGYVVFTVLTLTCAVMSLRRRAPLPVTVQLERSDDRQRDDTVSPTTWAQRGTWVARSLVPSSLLLGVTTYLSTDIAPVPLLWTVPLTLYLLSFVLAFAPVPLVPPAFVARAMALFASALMLFMACDVGGPIQVIVPVHLVTFFLCALHLHTALAGSRPSTRHLTEFYLWIAVGGVLGGFINTFAAPVLFTAIVEYPAALVAACVLLRWPAEEGTPQVRAADVVLAFAVAIVAALMTYAVSRQAMQLTVAIALLTPLAVWCYSFSRRPVRFGLALGMMLIAMKLTAPNVGSLLEADRTFFGVLRVRAAMPGPRHVLMHGNTIHGEQSREDANRREPLTYYHRSGPIGQLIDTLSDRLSDAEVGVVGLGAGSLAAYAQPGQRWTFYEIDPAVVRIASDPAFFTYLRDCGSACEVVLGDARLSLSRAGDPTYRLLVLDAFSSDAIPVHLMTREALDLYLRRLERDGVLAFHISNRHLRLRPVLAALAAEKGLAAIVRRDARAVDERHHDQLPSEWFLMARSAHAFGRLMADARWERPPVPARTRIWTDDYSDIIAVLGAE
jgi:hypothetical protein